MRIFAVSLALGVGWLVGEMAFADEASKTPTTCKEIQTCGSEGCCCRCGCRCDCDKYCKVVCEMKEVKKTAWVVHCEEFCPPLPCRPLCGGCGRCDACNGRARAETCDACAGGSGKCDVCANLENRNYRAPTCGKIREKKTLEKKEIVCKVPSYKCVVEYCCATCGQPQSDNGEKAPPPKSTPVTPAPASPAPPAPVPNATTLEAPLPPSNEVTSAAQ